MNQISMNAIIEMLFSVRWQSPYGGLTINDVTSNYDDYTVKITITREQGYKFYIEYFSHKEAKLLRKQIGPATELDWQRLINITTIICLELNFSEEGEIFIEKDAHDTCHIHTHPLLEAFNDDEIVNDIEKDTREWLSVLFDNHVLEKTSTNYVPSNTPRPVFHVL